MRFISQSRGNALFIIMIGIVMFAALSFAMWESYENTGPGASSEMVEIYSTEIVEYANNIADAVMKLRALGCDDNQLSFERRPFDGSDSAYVNASAPGDFSCHLFHPDGGGMKERDFPNEIYDPVDKAAILGVPGSLQSFNAQNRIIGVRSSTAELIFFVTAITQNICESINQKLGLGFDTIPDDSTGFFAGSEYFTGSYASGNNTDASVGDGTIFEGSTQGCVNESIFCAGGSCNHYFRVLVAK